MLKLLNFQVKGENYLDIPQLIGTKYFKFGIQLLNDETGEKVDSIVSRYRGEAQEINLNILKLWIRGEGKPPDWDNLIEALKAIGLVTLASDMQEGLQLASEIHR